MSPNRLQLGFFLTVVATLLLGVESHQDEGKQEANWPWEKPHKFQCPQAFGRFSDPTDCSSYYVCVAKIATRKSCKRMTLFDKNLKVCVSFIIAVCDNSGKETTTKQPNTGLTTPDDSKFVCPNLLGTFAHPTDCKKYYTCAIFIPSSKTCPDNELFDGVKKQCKPAGEVHCGTRIRPTEATTPSDTTLEIQTPETTSEAEEEETTPTEEETTTVEEETTTVEEETTTAQEETTTAEDETTTVKEETTTKVRVTAPDTTCDVDDLDCIIDDLGENPIWFVCDEDMGSYPHPTSNKLFIFCMNWKPTVKKCGQDLVFSEDLMTCVSP